MFQSLIDIQEAILRQLDDKDLTIVQAALCVDGLPNVIGSSKLLEALQNVLRRCIGKLLSGKCAILKIIWLKLIFVFCIGVTKCIV